MFFTRLHRCRCLLSLLSWLLSAKEGQREKKSQKKVCMYDLHVACCNTPKVGVLFEFSFDHLPCAYARNTMGDGPDAPFSFFSVFSSWSWSGIVGWFLDGLRAWEDWMYGKADWWGSGWVGLLTFFSFPFLSFPFPFLSFPSLPFLSFTYIHERELRNHLERKMMEGRKEGMGIA